MTRHQPEIPVVVLIGAGASKASGDYRAEQAPPLTRELFDTPRADFLLRTNKVARGAVGALRTMMADRAETVETLAFEAALRALRDDGHTHHGAYAAAVPPFLREMMLGYSVDLAAEQTRYNRLVDRLLQLPTDITFVSLNYDVLLDDHLDGLRPLNTFEDYLPTPRGPVTVGGDGTTFHGVPANRGGRWALIKPHGSVAWCYPPRTDSGGTTVPKLKCLAMYDLASGGPVNYQPALALPVGEKDELLCPPSHLDYLQSRLDAPEIDLLVLGYSGIDTEILTLVRDRACRIRRLTIVNQHGLGALEVLQRLDEHGVRAVWPDVVVASYSEWIDNGGLRTWTEDFGQQFEHVTDPEQARIKLLPKLSETNDGVPDWLSVPILELGRETGI